ncbi:endonuclease domain-containing protein [Demequina maris]|uniref:endonuclease domain-containing protein n=1 Tax=Demequina maris TaxID=1638982 RepID=UPI00078465A7|nr:hypothetical protein [Demequina maris]
MTHLRSLPTADATGSLAETLRRYPRAFTFEELVGLSSERKARTSVARGEAVRLLPNVYVGAVHAESFTARVDAALLWAGPNAALSGVAAMFLWGFVTDPPAQIEIAIPHAERPYPPSWIRLRRLTYTPPTVRLGRATVVGPDLAVIFGYGMLPRDRRATAVHRAFSTGFTTPRGLQAALERVPRCLARKELTRRIDSAARGAESYLEEKGLRNVFNTKEFARLLRQHLVRAAGETYRLDMYDPATMTAIELDGAAFHTDPLSRQRDLRRDANLARVGIQTVRLTYRDITERPEWCRALVRGVLEARSAR